MPPMMMTGIIKGMAASLDASAISEYEARFFLNPPKPQNPELARELNLKMNSHVFDSGLRPLVARGHHDDLFGDFEPLLDPGVVLLGGTPLHVDIGHGLASL